MQEESSFYTQINDFLSYIYPRYTQALELHVIRMLRILHVIPLKYRSDYKSNLKTSFRFALFVIPVLSFLWSSPRPISDSQLHVLPHFHLCPIYLVVFKGSYYLRMGYLILRGASRLDAFSVYPFQTWLPCYAIGMTTGEPAVRPARSSRTKASSFQISYARAG